MLAKIHSGAVLGIDAFRIDVEIDITLGFSAFHLVGLPDSAVRESRLRIQSAMENLALDFPRGRRVTVNLAPASIRKDGTALDLPIALALMVAQGDIPRSGIIDLGGYLIVGELALDGRVRKVRGALSLAVLARDRGYQGVIVPVENADEAAVVRDIDVIAIDHLRRLIAVLQGRGDLEEVRVGEPSVCEDPFDTDIDFAQVAGQAPVKRALEVAAAGGHNVLMIGPPGSGKSMLARRIPTILPPMSFEEALETTRIYSVTGHLPHGGLLRRRPFRAPHHTISDVGLAGGGSGIPRPGELSLAHNGVLFLDEVPEFRRSALEVLRQPLENGSVTLTRSMLSVTYPADLMLVAAMNPCRCGHFGDSQGRCQCSLDEVRRYRNRLSGPLLDRIDLHVEVPAVPYAEIRRAKRGESSELIRGRVTAARKRQMERFEGTGIFANNQMGPDLLREYCALDSEGHQLLESAVERFALSARSCDRILKVSRTIADLDGTDALQLSHLAEAIQYRNLDRQNHSPGRLAG